MSRKPRLFVPGCVHHVMSRGIEGRDIFNSDDDRNHFCQLLAYCLNRSAYQCLAWSLLPNHYHLVLRASDRPLSEVMKPLNSRYARWFRMKNNQRGYLFQDRYKSIVTQDQNYVEELVRYVHLNPLRAGICKTLEDLDSFPWCGHSALMGIVRCGFQDTEQVLRRFGSTDRGSRIAYREYIAKGVSVPETDLTVLVRQSNVGQRNRREPSCWVIGDREFVSKAIAADRQRRMGIARHAASGLNSDRLAKYVSGRFGVKPADLRFRSRIPAVAEARKVFAYLGYRELGISCREIAEYLNVTPSAVSQMIGDGGMIAERVKVSMLNN